MKNSSLPPSSRSSLPISSGSEHFFGRKGRGLIPALVAGTLISCGGGPTEENNNPVNNIPLQASALVELGPITGASVQFTTLSGNSLATGGTNSDGSLNYNPRDIVSRMGNDQWIVVRVSGGSDIDADDDGVVDTTWTPVNGSFRVLLPRSFLETGERIIINPRAGVISEALLNRQNPNLSLSALDTIARESGGSDVNGDGKVSYRDIVSIQMKNVTDVSKVVPAASGYIQSVHTGNETTKSTALKNIVRTENHIVAEIVSDTDTNSHNPMLHLKSVSSGATILYTLDGSSPLPNSGTTSRATGEVYIPLQNKKVYYREQFVMSGETVLGRVKGFDLLEDWIELAQTEQTYNTIGREGYISNSYSYKGQNYLINVWTNKISPGYTYPKLIDCQVGISSNDGCQYGPYIAYNENHEQRIRALIDTAVKSYIDTNVQTPINPDSPSETIANNVSYSGGYYSIFNEWTINTTTGKRTYPVRVWGRYTSKSGTTGTTEGGTATNDTTRANLNQSIVATLKTRIDQNTTPTPTHTQNQLTSYSGKIDNYYGGWYEVLNQWNLSGTADFPVSIIGTYATPTGGRMSNLTATAATESERITKSNQMVSQIQSAIIASYNSLPRPTYPQNYVINSGFVSYRGYGYNLITTMNITGTSDYPAKVYATYTTPSGTGQTQTLTANSSTELAQIQTERANQAKALIDNALSTDQYTPNYVETVTPARSYATGSYRTTFTYSGNVGQDYPGYVDVYYTRGNGTSTKWTMQATNANEKSTYISLGENQAKLEIDNYPLYTPNTITNSGVISYGTRGSNYTIYAKYNRVGTGYNYPALVWIEYRSGTSGILLDTRNTYGVMEARNSEHKDQIKAQLESWVRGQILATAPAATQLATNTKWNIGDILISNAYAQTSSSITVGKGVSKVTPYASYNGNYLYGQSYFSGLGIQGLYTKWASGTTNISKRNIQDIETEVNARVIESLHKYELGQNIALGDMPESMRTAIGNVFLDLGKYIGNLPGLIQKHQANLIAAGVPDSVINNMWTKIDDIWNKSMEPLGTISDADIVLTIGGGELVIKYIVTGTGKILAKLISGPGAKAYLEYEASLMAAAGTADLGLGTVKLLSSAVTAEQLQTIAVAKAIPGITRLGGGASILYGNAANAEALLGELVKKGWKCTGEKIASDGTRLFLYESSNGLSQVGYRVVSGTQFSGYNVSATLDLSTRTSLGIRFSPILTNPSEIKFINPKLFTP